MSERVFAYGSNMCSGRLRDYSVLPEEPGRPALLKGYQLCFNKKSIKDGSGKANVMPDTGNEVWGVLYTIPDAHLQTLDDGEGSGYYRAELTVRTSEGEVTGAWVYMARKPSQDTSLRPYTWYVRFLVEGAREHGLPAHYVENLESIESEQDKNQERDREKRLMRCGTA